MTEKISVRWGIPSLDDKGGIYLYGFMLRNYARIGVTRDEFLCIVHMAAYCYEVGRGQSSPAINTIAELMGYAHENSARNLIKSLQEKGLLQIEHRSGATSIYNFHGFASAVLALEEEATKECTPTLGCSPTPTLQCTPPLHPNVPEEEETTKKTKGKNNNTTTIPKATKVKSSPKEKAPANPNTAALMAAFVECLPEALRAAFDYAMCGKRAKKLAQIAGLEPKHIRTYYGMLRAQWNRSPAMRDRPIKFFDVANFIEARAQNSNLAEIEPTGGRIGRGIESVTGMSADDYDAMQEEARERRERAEPTPHLEAWERVAASLRGQMTAAGYSAQFGRAHPRADFDGQTLVVDVPAAECDWIVNRLGAQIELAAKAAQIVAIRFEGVQP